MRHSNVTWPDPKREERLRLWDRYRGQTKRRYKAKRYLYVIRAGQSSWYKIGVSSTPRYRVATIQQGNPYPLVYILLLGPYGYEALDLETEMLAYAISCLACSVGVTHTSWFKAKPHLGPEAIRRRLLWSV